VDTSPGHRTHKEPDLLPFAGGGQEFALKKLLGHTTLVTPERWRGAVVYTLAELEHLRGMSPEELRTVHAVKSIFEGTVGANGTGSASRPSESR
jgi:hypothetical protein